MEEEFYPLTEVDLKAQFKSETGMNIGSDLDVLGEETFIKSDESSNILKYIEWLQDIALKYQNNALIVKVANDKLKLVELEEELDG